MHGCLVVSFPTRELKDPLRTNTVLPASLAKPQVVIMGSLAFFCVLAMQGFRGVSGSLM